MASSRYESERDGAKQSIAGQIAGSPGAGHATGSASDRKEKIVATLAGHRGMIQRAEYRNSWGKDSTALQEYDYFLRGADLMSASTRQALEQAIANWKEGMTRFPDSNLLKVQGALMHVVRPRNYWSETPEEDFRKAGKLVRDAMAERNLSPMTRIVGHHALAFVYASEHRSDRALAEAEMAFALAPYDGPTLLFLTEVVIAIGQPARALEWIDRAAELIPQNDPLQSLLVAYRAWALAADSQSEEALDALSDTRLDTLRQVDPIGEFILFMRAIVLAELGRLEEGAMVGTG